MSNFKPALSLRIENENIGYAIFMFNYNGDLSLQSDWGDGQYSWGRQTDFIGFMCGCNSQYITNKLVGKMPDNRVARIEAAVALFLVELREYYKQFKTK